MDSIPKPEETGGAGTQTAAAGKLEVVTDTPAYASPLSDTLYGLAATNTKLSGSDVTTKVIAASVSQLTQDLQVTRKELKEARVELNATKDALATANQDKAVLGERLANLAGARHLRNIAIMIGTALAGFGFKFVTGPSPSIGYVLLGTGAFMILIAWFVGPMKSKP